MASSSREIIVTITGGSASVETKGFSGTECLAETMELERALGKVASSTPTAEMRKQPLKAGIKAGQ